MLNPLQMRSGLRSSHAQQNVNVKEPQRPVPTLKLWPDQTEEKARRVKAEGDFSVNSSALSKKYREVLMGRGPSDGVERREVLNDSENLDQKVNLNENQKALHNEIREKLLDKAKIVAKSALKRDGDADLDPEGYRNVSSDAQAFRAAQARAAMKNEVKRVRFPLPSSRQNQGLVNHKRAAALQGPEKPALQPAVIIASKREESKRANAPAAAPQLAAYSKQARGKDIVHETILKRDDLTLEIGKLFLRIVGTDLGMSISSEAKVEESKKAGQVLVLREMQKLTEPSPDERSGLAHALVEESSREEVTLLASHLGKVFVDIGLTLPSGHSVEDARKNDLIARSIGSKAIDHCAGAGGGGAVGGILSSHFSVKSDSQRAQKSELIATAIGRILMHLRGASQMMTARMEAPTIEQTAEDTTILNLGRLTLQMIEQSAMSDRVSGKIGYESRRQGEGFIRKLGLAVFKGASALGGSVDKPLVEDARRVASAAAKQSNKFTGTDEGAKSQASTVEVARKQDSLKQKATVVQTHLTPNNPLPASLKQPVKESEPLKMNGGAPSIDTLPSSLSTRRSMATNIATKAIKKTEVHLGERATALHPSQVSEAQNEKEKPIMTSKLAPSRQKTTRAVGKVVEVGEEIEEEECTRNVKKRTSPAFQMINEIEEQQHNDEEPQKSVWKQKTFKQ